jgi:RimJ/RimL family protein N-acetyltransferase
VRRRERPRGGALFVPLETARLRLEPIRADHADGMFDGLREPSLYDYQTDEPPRDLASLGDRYARLAAGHSTDELAHWLNWIFVRRDGGGTAGYVQATVDKDLSRAEIGYLVLPAQQRRGFGGEAVDAMNRHLLAAGVRALHATIDTRNAASIALIERLGFRRARTRRSDDVIGGVRGLDHEYELRRPRAAPAPAPNTPA